MRKLALMPTTAGAHGKDGLSPWWKLEPRPSAKEEALGTALFPQVTPSPGTHSPS